MAISLSKNQTISLEKEAGAGLKKIRMGLGWDPVKPSGFFAKLLSSDTAIDLDASCILLDSAKQPLDLVWFRQLKSKDGSIRWLPGCAPVTLMNLSVRSISLAPGAYCAVPFRQTACFHPSFSPARPAQVKPPWRS